MKVLRKIIGLISLVIFIGMLGMPVGIFMDSLSPHLQVVLEHTGMHFVYVGMWMSLISLIYLTFWGLIKPAKVKRTAKIRRKIIGVASLASIIIMALAGFTPGFTLAKIAGLIIFGLPLYLVYWGLKR